MRLATAAFVVVCSAVCAPSVRAQATVTFNHRAASADPLTDVIAERVFKPGTDFIVNILETCPGAFTYTVRALRRETPPPVGSQQFESGGPGPAPLEQKTIGPIRYDDQYGGYIIDVHKSTEGADCVEYFVKGEKTPAVPQPRQVTRVAVNPDDANSPTKLMEGKPRAAVFVGVSFAFLGAQDKFKKPLGIDQPAAGAAPDPNR